jgi:acyl-homoserine-lactone acylase
MRSRAPRPRSPSTSVWRLPLPAILTLVVLQGCAGPETSTDEVTAWQARADRVEIIRDEWGVPHIYAPTDADAVFGLMYAQAEDDFNRIEVNFLTALGRMAEAEGEERLWQDLRMRLFIDPEELQAMYDESPSWLRDLMDGWADGLNYYLHTHPETEPMVLTRFEPWMALSFSEGSIGGDIERVNLGQLEAFYGDSANERVGVGALPGATGAATAARPGLTEPAGPTARTGLDARPQRALASALVQPDPDAEPRGSNGIAIAPENTRDGHALLLINPHTSFFFRHEAHVVSDEGLNAYGALTWGQFFVYQGFNETAGWMHTSSSVDNIDEFAETVIERDDELFYAYGDEERPIEIDSTVIRYRIEGGTLAERAFTTYRTHHGPIVRAADGRWISVALMEEPMRALIQSYARTKAANLDEYLEVMGTHTNSSNNTLFADAEGNVAYLHSNFVPVRDTSFDYGAPVDGSNPATDWNGVHSLEESPNAINPATGFVFCTNNWPWSAAGEASPDSSNFPAYMDRGGENARGVHVLEVVPGRTDFTLESLQEIAYSTRVPWFDDQIPQLIADYDALPPGEDRDDLAPAIARLREWDMRWGEASVATSVALFWGTALGRSDDRVGVLREALDRLTEDFGRWDTPWGEINRFQRVNGDIEQPFDDDLPSTPVGFTSSRWGSLASFGAGPYPGTKRWYGTNGNSFVAVVEFGDSLRARAVTAGGLNHDPDSPHFNDQAERYAHGDLRDVYFYRADVEAHAERTYRPGEN